MLHTSRSITRLLSILLLTAPLYMAHAQDQASPDQTSPDAPTPAHKSHKKPAPLVLPPLPGGPLKQVPMDLLPAAAPKVTYQGGLLTISAQNSTLGEILRDVRKLTGAAIEIPQGGANERVVTQLGPGAPRDILALLLNGTSFNYVMLGSTSDPSAVATVLLSVKPSAAGEVQTAAANTFQPGEQPMMPGGRMPLPQPFRQQQIVTPGVAPAPAPAAGDEDSADDSDKDDDKDDDSAAAQPAQPGQPAVVQPTPNGQPDQQVVDPNQPNAGPKTPEQILQMLRQGHPPNNPDGPPQDEQ